MIRKEKIKKLKEIVEDLKTIEVISQEKNSEDKFLQSEAAYFKLNNGAIISRERLIKGKNKLDGSAAIIIPLIDDEILTVIEPRVFTDLTVGVGFPAGYIENDENPEHGALRELKEETGFIPEKIIKIDSFYQDEGCSSALNHIFIALNCQKISNQSLDEDEIIKYMLFSYEELLELESLGYIKGGNSKLALAKCKKYIK